MYANLEVKPDGYEAIPALEVRIMRDQIIVVEDMGDGASTKPGPGKTHTLGFDEIPEGGISIRADY